MNKRKKIISIVIKSLIGIASFLIIYFRLREDLTADKLELLKETVFSSQGLFSLLVCLLLIPVNWGIESYKWKIITAPVEEISFKNAQRSVYSGVCLGNLAPGRATEFIAKIIYFKPESRPRITVLHFVNGMFQLSVTYLIGFVSLAYRLKRFGEEQVWIAYVAISTAALVIVIFTLCIIKIDWLLEKVSKKITRQQPAEVSGYRFTGISLFQLFGYSFARYAVFFLQMALLFYLFSGVFSAGIALGIALYFLITTTIPMISFLEAAIRAAVALVVFKGCGVSDTALALSSVTVWFINIILPSIAGYFFLLKQNFDFKLHSSKK